MNWKQTQCCGTYRHWDIECARTKSGAVRGDVYAYCFADIAWPSSVHKHFRDSFGARFINRDRGADCPLYVKREVAK